MKREDLKLSIVKRYFEEDETGLHAATLAVEPLPCESVEDLAWRCLTWKPNGLPDAHPNLLGALEVRIIEPAKKGEG